MVVVCNQGAIHTVCNGALRRKPSREGRLVLGWTDVPDDPATCRGVVLSDFFAG